ncbi:MAG: hypothetical protein PVI33_03350 [Candidatus Omnitrophota bacterium]|jgi:hypothetical protein
MVKQFRKITEKQLGEMLMDKGVITRDQLKQALRVQQEKGGLIGEILVALGYVKKDDISWAVERQKELDKKGSHKLIGELLMARKLITKEQLDTGLAIQQEKGGLIGEILVALGYVEEADIALALTSQYGFPYLPLESYEISPEIIQIIPEEVARQYLLLPIDKFGNNLSIAISNPLDSQAIEQVEKLVGINIQIFVSTSTDIKNAIEKYYKKSDQ